MDGRAGRESRGGNLRQSVRAGNRGPRGREPRHHTLGLRRHRQGFDRARAEAALSADGAGIARGRLSSLRKVKMVLSLRTRPAISCVVVIQVRPMIGAFTATTGPRLAQAGDGRGRIAQILLRGGIHAQHRAPAFAAGRPRRARHAMKAA